MSHTKGPWSRNIPPATKYNTIFAGRNTHVCHLHVSGLPVDEVEANCQLITAAPDLLAALKMAERFVDSDWDSPSMDETLSTIRAAIVKAEVRP